MMAKSLGRERSNDIADRVAMFSEHNLYSLPPALVDPHEFPFDLRRKVAEQRVGSRMNMQRWSDQKKQRLFRSKYRAAEISKARKFAACVMPFHSRPIIQPLQGKMNIFIRFEFHYR